MRKVLMAFGILAGWIALITWCAPEEATQGWSQKIFYFHVPHAIAMYVFFILSAIASVMFLRRKEGRLDTIAASALEMGLMCCLVVLTTGPIWAKPIWGTYWTWEPRLTTTLFLFLIFLAALASRFAFANPARGRTAAALLSIVGCLDIPLVHYSVKLWRGVHPSVLKNPEGLTPAMRVYFLVSMAFMVFFGYLIFSVRLVRGGARVSQ